MKNDSKTVSKVSIAEILKEFWVGTKSYKVSFFVSFLFFVIGGVINIFVPIFYKQFFDILGQGGAKNLMGPGLVKIILVILLLHGINWLFFQTGMIIYNFMEAGVMARLRQNSFNYMMLHSYGFFAGNFSGSLVQRVNRFSRSFERLADSLVFNLMPLFIIITGAIIVTWIMAPIVSIVILAWVVIFTTFNVSFSLWKQKYDVAVALADTHSTAVLADDITNNSAISLFNSYDHEVSSYKDVTNDQARKTVFSWSMGQIVDMVQALLIFLVEFFAFYYAITFWQKGAITIGTFVLIQVYIIGVAQQLWGLNRIIRGIYESIADSREMVEILHTPHEIKDIPDAKDLAIPAGAITFKDVSFNFNDTREVLHGINLSIIPGEKIALVGPSGAGKTTFVRLILRLYDVSRGDILIDHQSIHDVTQDSLHESISFVPQDPILFHRTLLDNIRYGRKNATDEEVVFAAKLAHCDEFIEQLPLKYETYVGERGIKLSGGERQRVAIARAILKNAPILILDEATSSLDSHSEALIQDALETLMKGRTTIVIAHRLSTIRKMDRIIVMEEGVIIEEGTHNDLIKIEGGLYQKLWNLQAGGFIK